MSQAPYGFVRNSHLLRVALYNNDLQNRTFGILALLSSFANQKGVIQHFNISTVANDMNISRQAIQNHIKKLLNKGYITIKYRKGRVSSYYLNYKKISEAPAIIFGCRLHNEDATLLDCGCATSDDYKGATQSDCTKKTIDKTKKAKRAFKNLKGRNVELQDWHINLIKDVDDAYFRSWFLNYWWDGKGTLYVENSFIENYAKKEQMNILTKHLPNLKNIEVNKDLVYQNLLR